MSCNGNLNPLLTSSGVVVAVVAVLGKGVFVLAFVLSHISLLPHHPTLNPKHNFTAHSQQQPLSFVAMSYAPECLVAFAFAGRWLDREPGNRHDDRSQSSRLYSILDSLASICVCKGKGEVYAIAI